jgi:hypothetical protein
MPKDTKRILAGADPSSSPAKVKRPSRKPAKQTASFPTLSVDGARAELMAAANSTISSPAGPINGANGKPTASSPTLSVDEALDKALDGARAELMATMQHHNNNTISSPAGPINGAPVVEPVINGPPGPIGFVNGPPAASAPLQQILLEKTISLFNGGTQYAIKNSKFNNKFHARHDIFGKHKHNKDAAGTFTTLTQGKLDFFRWVTIEKDSECGNIIGFLIRTETLDKHNNDIERMLVDINRVLRKEGYVLVLGEDADDILVLTLITKSNNRKIIKGTGVSALMARPKIVDELNLERRVSTQGCAMVPQLFNEDAIDGKDLIIKISTELAKVGVNNIRYEVFDSEYNLIYEIKLAPDLD